MLFQFHPGETFVINFVIPFAKEDVKAVAVSFRNGGRVAYEATVTSCVREDATHSRIGYLLSQEESLLFDENTQYWMQLNVYGPHGSRATSKEVPVKTLAQQLKDPGISKTAFRDTYSGFKDGIDMFARITEAQIDEMTQGYTERTLTDGAGNIVYKDEISSIMVHQIDDIIP